MSPPGRPKGEYRSAQHEGTPVSRYGSRPAEERKTQRCCPLRRPTARATEC